MVLTDDEHWLLAPAAAESAGVLRAALARALASDSPAVGRLSYARTSVTFTINDPVTASDTEQITLLLDRRPAELCRHPQPAEIEITLTPNQATRLANGQLPMPAATINGEINHRGPIRKYLEIDPILRGLLTTTSHPTNNHHPTTPPVPDTNNPDPQLLAIETRDLHKRFGSNQVLTGTNLQIPEGSVSVVLGPSGTGKSVLLQHIIGLMRADHGEVLVRGKPLSHMSRSELLALRTEIGVMFQDGALFSTMNLYDNVAFPLRQHTNLHETDIHDVVMDKLQNVGLANAATRMPNQLSGGMRKRAGLARALVLNPGIILCDEPDSGLDPVRTALLGDLLLQQHTQLGGTILIITHNVELATRISDHISILHQGKIIEAHTTQTILNSNNPFVQQFLTGETQGPLGMN